VTKVVNGKSTVVGDNLSTPPDNIGPRSTPNYHALAQKGVQTLSDGTTVFAGQRDDPFFGDIGAAFDLVAIRNGTGATGGGKDFFAGYATHSIALQVPASMLDKHVARDRRVGGDRPPADHPREGQVGRPVGSRSRAWAIRSSTSCSSRRS